MEEITVKEASARKGCSGQAVRDAIKAGLLDAKIFARTYVVKCNKKWQQWSPNTDKQKAGKARAKKANVRTKKG